MRYQITGYNCLNDDYHNGIEVVLKYTSDIIPHIDEHIVVPHKGTYKVLNVIHYVTDDREEYDNKLMFVDLYLHMTHTVSNE